MTSAGETVSDAVASAADFARDAARHLWGVQTLAALGIALLFVAQRGRIGTADAVALGQLGWWAVVLTAAPLWGALYRLELGGKARRGLGLGGLQFGKPELRLIALVGAFGVAAAMFWLPVVAVSALCFILFRGLGSAPLGPLGDIQVSFLIVLALWIAASCAFAWLCGRCAFAAAATVGKRRLVLQEAWTLGAGREVVAVWCWLLAQAPAFLVVVLLALVDSMVLADPVWGAMNRWPLLDSSIGGLALGFIFAFVQGPLTVGVLGYLYRARRERVRVFTARVRSRYEAELLAG